MILQLSKILLPEMFNEYLCLNLQEIKICQLSKHLLSIVLKSGIKIIPNQNALFGAKLMPRDRLSYICYKMQVYIFPQVATRDSKQYLQELMIPESVMGVYHKGGGGSTTSDQSSIFDVFQDCK